MRILDIDFCVPEDADDIHAIETACFEDPWSRVAIEHDLNEQGAIVYMKAVTDKGQIAGFAVISMDEGASHLLNIAVLPEFRNNLIAKQLLLAVEVISEEWGFRKMILEVRPSNRAARDLYSSIGFVYVKRKIGYYSNGEDALVLTADLPLKIADRYGY